METTTNKSRDNKSQSSSIVPDFTHRLYHSNTINKDPLTVFEFVKDEAKMKQVLVDLPDGIKNFLDLSLESAASYTVKFKNNEKAKVHGDITFSITPGPADKGAVLTAIATFGNYSSKDEGPSDLINLFLKRIKAMIETGVLATTRGQPNGEDETDSLEFKH